MELSGRDRGPGRCSIPRKALFMRTPCRSRIACAVRFHRAAPVRLACIAAIAFVAIVAASRDSAWAQAPAKERPAAQDITLTTKDGLNLRATFYPGTKGRETVPVLLLHMKKGGRVDYQELALALQDAGHAVLVPDLRAHGDSAWIVNNLKVDPDKMNRNQLASMEVDVEACKSYLMDKNNAGELNIDKLCVVGAELGAMLAMNWSAKDWAVPPLAVGKQGQDVKALVLLSPAWSMNGYNINVALQSPAIQKALRMYIIYGKKKTDAERIEDSVKRFRGKEKEKNEPKTYFAVEVETSLEGTKLLTSPDLKMTERITNFIEQQVVPMTFPWKDRKLF
jgi:pimeloyl-ACP methyl ester carboxylesterase